MHHSKNIVRLFYECKRITFYQHVLTPLIYLVAVN